MKAALLALSCCALFGCGDGDATNDFAVARDLAVAQDLSVPRDLSCPAGLTHDCFANHACCAPCPQSGSYSPTDPCDVVGLICAYETYAFECGSDHRYHCHDYQATFCGDGGI
jgi:hypothetical protein